MSNRRWDEMADRAAILLVCLPAFGLRAWELGTKSLWFDEGLSLVFAEEPLRQMLPVLAERDLHPPLYSLLLHFWTGLAGTSEFALRFPSAVAGVLMAAVIYWFGKRLTAVELPERAHSGAGWAVWAAALVALSSPLITYSQEARMYTLLALFGLLSTAALWRALEPGPGQRSSLARWWLLYFAGSVALVYTHYFGALVIVFQACYLALTVRHYRRRAWPWLACLLAVALSYVPWWWGAASQIRRLVEWPDFWPGTTSVVVFLQRTLTTFILGTGAATMNIAPVLVVAALVAVLWLMLREKDARIRRGMLFVTLYLVIPLGLLYAILAVQPKFMDRYVLLAMPAFFLMLAYGLRAVAGSWSSHWGRARYGLTVVLAAGGLLVSGRGAWAVYYQDYPRDDTRGLGQFLTTQAVEGDVIVLLMDTSESFRYYYRGTAPYRGLSAVRHQRSTADELGRILQGKQRAWLVLWNMGWADPARFVPELMDEIAIPRPLSAGFRGYELRLYQLTGQHVSGAGLEPEHPMAANFGGQMELLGHDSLPTTMTAGQTMATYLFWQTLQQIKEDLVVSLRLRQGQLFYWRKQLRPAGYEYPPRYWAVRQPMRLRTTFQVPVGTPPGEYDLELAVYSIDRRQDLEVTGAQGDLAGYAVRLAQVRVERPDGPADVSRLGLDASQARRVADTVELLSGRIHDERAQAGQTFNLTLYWRALASTSEDYQLALTLLDAAGVSHELFRGRPVGGRYPTTQWQAGELVTDHYLLTVPREAAAGEAQLYLTLVGPEAGEALPLGRLEVLGRQPLMEPPAVQHPTSHNLANLARLVGYDLPTPRFSPGGRLPVVLYWQALSTTDESYKVFVHLLDEQEQVRAQQDNPPGSGKHPTTAWVAGEYIRDEYELTLGAEVSPGEYQLEVGMYHPETGKRLLLLDSEGRSLGDRILLGAILVVPK